MNPIYFDHAATTPMSQAAIQVYIDAVNSGPGNPSSLHQHGRAARARVTAARDRLADLLGCAASELVFTGSGTESDNAALYGAVLSQRLKGRTGIVTTAIEHHAVLNTCKQLEAQGFKLTILPVDDLGQVAVSDAEAAIDDSTAIVSIMAGNNEMGTLQPIAQIGELARKYKALMHVDAVQAFGYMSLQMRELPIDLLSISAHKLNGPQGIGLLYVRKGILPLEPLIIGGSQERKRRAGTENVGAIAAFAKAAEDAIVEREMRYQHVLQLRNLMIEQLTARIGADAFRINGNPDNSLPHILNISFMGIPAESMLMNLDIEGIAASGGSACTSGSLQPSHVLAAMKLSPEIIVSAVRFSFGLGNTIEEVEKATQIIATIWARLRYK